ncbi:MAG: DUF3829 domain-containing protein [Polyangiaceae bacterium]|nr:DUF3829 domain-containing protein [Polyangiaceae bacterium]
MSALRSFLHLPFALLVTATAVGCSEEKPKPDPSAAAASASASASAKGRLNLRTPLAPSVKVDPQATKNYRVEVCYFGTMTLRQARDAYLASLGGAEPSEKKVPNFGGVTNPAAAATGAPTTKPAAAPVVSTKPATPAATATAAASAAKPATPAATGTAAAKPATSTSAAASAPTLNEPPGRRPFDVALRAPHERNARACSVAAGLKDAPMAEVDAALQAYAPFAVELAKAVGTATTYYQREEFKKDSFEKGKQLHKQLTDGFAKLDEMADKLAAAVDAWHKAHPADTAKMDEGEKLAAAAYNDAREALLAVGLKKANAQAFKDAAGRLEKSLEALKTYASSHPTDPWGKMMNPSIESMLKASKEAGEKVSDKGIDPDTYLVLVNSFVSVIEAKYRALSRSTTMKAAPANSAAPAVGTAAPAAPTGQPAPNPE